MGSEGRRANRGTPCRTEVRILPGGPCRNAAVVLPQGFLLSPGVRCLVESSRGESVVAHQLCMPPELLMPCHSYLALDR